MKKVFIILNFAAAVCITLLLITTSVWQPLSPEDAVRPATRPYEFDYFSWTVNAFWDKASMAAFGFNHYLDHHQDRQIIRDYFALVNDNNDLQNKIEAIFSNPSIADASQASSDLRTQLESNQQALRRQTLLAESVIQKQISSILDSLGLSSLGQPFPPVLYHATELPKELVVSRRDKIEEVTSVSLRADISLDQIVALENKVEADTDYSVLVVSIGGVGTYPTMVINNSSLSFLIQTVAHEWTHNYLNLRPLGRNYASSPELRTMNETTANIAGEEISQAVLHTFYADMLPAPNEPFNTYDINYTPKSESASSSVFDFRQEMYKTRVHVDELLAKGKIDEAESYMEARRQIFWENGYAIRKLNQAYFAFHGAYADQQYSAAGEDPVGAAARKLRARSDSLADFIKTISRFSSYDQLSTLVNTY